MMARIIANAHSTVALGDVLKVLAEATRTEHGCVSYELFQNADNAAEFVTVEDWESDAAANAHMATRHVKEAIAKAMPLLGQAPAIHRFIKIG